jgi:ornithine carbamoyltransferase
LLINCLHLVHTSDAGYEPDDATVALAKAAGISSITITNDRNAVKGADVIYTDVWASMGQKDTLEKKLRDFGPYQVGGFALCYVVASTGRAVTQLLSLTAIDC